MVTMNTKVKKIISKGVEELLSFPKSTTVRVISHYDADGITAAAVLCRALYRAGYDFHATLLKHPFKYELSKIKEEGNEFVIFSDMGSGQINLIREFGCKVVIIDHHQPINFENQMDSVTQINTNLLGIDGNYSASGASMSFLFAMEMNKDNIDLAVLALAGAIGDKQHLGGFRGVNKTIFEDAIKNHLVEVHKGKLKVLGGKLIDDISMSIDPYYIELSGNSEKVGSLLRDVGLDGRRKYEELTGEEIKKLHSYLLLRFIKNNIRPEIVDTIIADRLTSNYLPDDLERFSDVIDACGKSGETGLALSVCLGDMDLYERAKNVESKYREKILHHLLELEMGKLVEETNFQYFFSPEASIGSTLSGIVMNYFPYKNKPVFSLTKKDGEIHISCRGTKSMVNRGLDLGRIMKNLSKKLGGSGGGHKIAAGGAIKTEDNEAILKAINEELSS